MQVGVIIKKDSTNRFDFSLSQDHLLHEIIIEKELSPSSINKNRAITTSISGISSDVIALSMMSTHSRATRIEKKIILYHQVVKSQLENGMINIIGKIG
ncbi:MAG: hypothetical protein ACJATI_005340 [Halioglobus sp.]|jgi:hypothetical protein